VAQSTSAPPQVMLAYLKYQWSLGDDYKRKEAFHYLQEIARELAEKNPVAPNGVMFLQNQASESVEMSSSVPLLARVHLKLGAWRWHLNSSLDEESVRGNFFLPSSHSIHNIGNHQLLSLDILVNLYLQNPFMCCRILTHCREELSLQLVGSLFYFFMIF
jgi:hypothetical protein